MTSISASSGLIQRSKALSCMFALAACHIITKQLIELALGLEASMRSYIWVVKEGDYTAELDKWLVEEQFEETVKDIGLVVRGWAPQVPILSHPAIGGFLTHCGWNSTLEGISSGLPMITWPMFAEQLFNEKLIVQVLKIGVRIGVEIPMKWGEEEKLGVMVNKDEIKKAIDQLMDEGSEGEDRRRRAKELGEMAKKTVEEGGSSYLNMTLIIQHVIEEVTNGNQSNYTI
ncbi:UDP-glycosyltransferase 73C4-like [Ricinus communis]|uniref:anthocyanidin 3-O-glucosyltransferase n=1 Tax=Ricinus communis TaxID=3988 RepID=B9S0A1_RICCO|nr:UDP-glycosyltransferase 73C4-like [Ricinus communis]EEF42834.1 UDP-glucosyltransferase, putative [Ricinus communis]